MNINMNLVYWTMMCKVDGELCTNTIRIMCTVSVLMYFVFSILNSVLDRDDERLIENSVRILPVECVLSLY